MKEVCTKCPLGLVAPYNLVHGIDEAAGRELTIVIEQPSRQDGHEGQILSDRPGQRFLQVLSEEMPGVPWRATALAKCAGVPANLRHVRACKGFYYVPTNGYTVACGVRVGGLLTGIRGAKRLQGKLVQRTMTTVTPEEVFSSRVAESTLRAHLRHLRRAMRPTAEFPPVQLIRTAADAASILRSWADIPLALDLETTGLDPWRGQIRLVGLSDGVRSCSFEPHAQGMAGVLQSFLMRHSQPWTMHNAAFDSLWLMVHYGVVVPVLRDTQIAVKIAWPDEASDLKSTAIRVLGVPDWGSEFAGFENKDWSSVSLEKLAPYNGADAYVTAQLCRSVPQYPDLEQRSLAHSAVVTKMRFNGVGVDMRRYKQRKREYEDKRDGLQDQFLREARKVWSGIENIRSGDQLRTLFFQHTRLMPETITHAGNASLDAAWMEANDEHRLVALLQQFRAVDKIATTYFSDLERYVYEDGRVHPFWRLGGAATWRLSCAAPNLTNQPDEAKEVYVASEGRLFVGFDLSQAELRVAADLSGEPFWVKAYSEGRDLHMETAQKLYGRKEITKDERSFAKMLNFATCYGLSERGLAKRAKLSEEEANDYLARFWRNVPVLQAWFQVQEEQALRDYESVNPYGRRRAFDRGASDVHVKNQARNSPIQSAVAEITLDIMVELDKVLPEDRACIVVQVHDAVIMDVDRALVPEVVEMVRRIAVKPPSWMRRVPLAIDVSVGPRLSEMESYA